MVVQLPHDILHMTCQALAADKDFPTLFNCALASKQLALPALTNIYRIQTKAPVIVSSSDDAVLVDEERVAATARWANLWRSIALSCLGKTYLLYAQFVRKLDFQDLEDLFNDSGFTKEISDEFFGKHLTRYRVRKPTKWARESLRRQVLRIDAVATMNKLATLITNNTPMLEKLKGTLTKETVHALLPKVTRLQRLRVFDGQALKGTGNLIRENCRHFSKVGFFNWAQSEADSECAIFLNELQPQTLRSFGTFSTSNLGEESFGALNKHSNTLTKLELYSITGPSIPHLSKLKDCVKLRSLYLVESRPASQDLENSHKEVFAEMVDWLSKCDQLRSLDIVDFKSAPSLLTPVVQAPGIEIRNLSLGGISLASSQVLLNVLSFQKNLKYLYLKGEGSERASENDVFVESLCRLTSLTELRLIQISEGFTEYHICNLLRHLVDLEYLATGGFHITDALWPDVSKLKSLKRLELSADTRFTAQGIIDFVSSLGPGNHGLMLNIMMQDTDCDISEDDQAKIRGAISSSVDGRFDFLLVRGPEEEAGFTDEEDSD